MYRHYQKRFLTMSLVLGLMSSTAALAYGGNILTRAFDGVFDNSNFFVDNYDTVSVDGANTGQNDIYQPYAYSGSRNPYGVIPKLNRISVVYSTSADGVAYPARPGIYQRTHATKPVKAHQVKPHRKAHGPSGANGYYRYPKYTFWPTVSYHPAYYVPSGF